MDGINPYNLGASFSFKTDAKTFSNLDRVISQLHQLESSVRKAADSMSRLDLGKALAGSSGGTTRHADKFVKTLEQTGRVSRSSSKDLGKIESKFKAIATEANNINFGNFQEGSQQFGKAEKATNRYAKALKHLSKDLSNNIDRERQLKAEIVDQTRKIKARYKIEVEQRKAMQAAERKGVAKTIGGVASGYMNAVTQSGRGAFKVLADFDEQMSALGAISQASAEDFDALRKKAKKLGASTRYTAKEAAEGMQFLALAGFNAQQQIEGIDSVLNLATAGMLEVAEASDIASDALSAYGLEVDQFGHVADVLAKTQSKANTNVAMLGEAFKYAASPAKAFGATIEETAAVLGVMADKGNKASTGGTAMRSAFLRLAAAPADARAALDELGVKTADKDGNLRNIIELYTELSGKLGLDDKFMSDLEKAGGDISKMKNMTKGQADAVGKATAIFGKNAVSANLAAMGSVEKLQALSLENFASSFDPKVLEAKLNSSGIFNNLGDKLGSKELEKISGQGQPALNKALQSYLSVTERQLDKGQQMALLQSRLGEEQATHMTVYQKLTYAAGSYTDAMAVMKETTDELTASGEGFLSTSQSMAEYIADNLGGDIKALGSAFEAFQMSVIEPLTPLLRLTIHLITNLLLAFANIPAPVRSVIVVLGATVTGLVAIVAAGAPVAAFFFSLAEAASTAAIATAGLTSSMSGVMPFTGFFGTALESFTATDALPGLTKFGTKFVQAFTPLQNLLARFTDSIPLVNRLLGSTGDVIIHSTRVTSRFISKGSLPLIGNFMTIAGVISLVLVALEKLAPEVSLVGTLLGAIAAPFGFLGGVIYGFLKPLGQLVGSGLLKLLELFNFPYAEGAHELTKALSDMFKAVQNTFAKGEQIGNAFFDLFAIKGLQLIAPLIAIFQSASGAWQRTVAHIRQSLSGLINFVTKVSDFLLHALAEGSPGLTSTIRDIWDKTIGHIASGLSWLGNQFSKVGSAIASVFFELSPIIEAILYVEVISRFTKAWSAGITAVTNSLTTLLPQLNNFSKVVEDFFFIDIVLRFTSAWQDAIAAVQAGFNTLFGTLSQWGTNINGIFTNPITNIVDKLSQPSDVTASLSSVAFSEKNAEPNKKQEKQRPDNFWVFILSEAAKGATELISIVAGAIGGALVAVGKGIANLSKFVWQKTKEIGAFLALIPLMFGFGEGDEQVDAWTNFFGSIINGAKQIIDVFLLIPKTIKSIFKSFGENLGIVEAMLLSFSSLPMNLTENLLPLAKIEKTLNDIGKVGILKDFKWAYQVKDFNKILPGLVALAISTGVINGIEDAISWAIGKIPDLSKALVHGVFDRLNEEGQQALLGKINEVMQLPVVSWVSQDTQFASVEDFLHTWDTLTEHHAASMVSYVQSIRTSADQWVQGIYDAVEPLLMFSLGDLLDSIVVGNLNFVGEVFNLDGLKDLELPEDGWLNLVLGMPLIPQNTVIMPFLEGIAAMFPQLMAVLSPIGTMIGGLFETFTGLAEIIAVLGSSLFMGLLAKLGMSTEAVTDFKSAVSATGATAQTVAKATGRIAGETAFAAGEAIAAPVISAFGIMNTAIRGFLVSLPFGETLVVYYDAFVFGLLKGLNLLRTGFTGFLSFLKTSLATTFKFIQKGITFENLKNLVKFAYSGVKVAFGAIRESALLSVGGLKMLLKWLNTVFLPFHKFMELPLMIKRITPVDMFKLMIGVPGKHVEKLEAATQLTRRMAEHMAITGKTAPWIHKLIKAFVFLGPIAELIAGVVGAFELLHLIVKPITKDFRAAATAFGDRGGIYEGVANLLYGLLTALIGVRVILDTIDTAIGLVFTVTFKGLKYLGILLSLTSDALYIVAVAINAVLTAFKVSFNAIIFGVSYGLNGALIGILMAARFVLNYLEERVSSFLDRILIGYKGMIGAIASAKGFKNIAGEVAKFIVAVFRDAARLIPYVIVGAVASGLGMAFGPAFIAALIIAPLFTAVINGVRRGAVRLFKQLWRHTQKHWLQYLKRLLGLFTGILITGAIATNPFTAILAAASGVFVLFWQWEAILNKVKDTISWISKGIANIPISKGIANIPIPELPFLNNGNKEEGAGDVVKKGFHRLGDLIPPELQGGMASLPIWAEDIANVGRAVFTLGDAFYIVQHKIGGVFDRAKDFYNSLAEWQQTLVNFGASVIAIGVAWRLFGEAILDILAKFALLVTRLGQGGMFSELATSLHQGIEAGRIAGASFGAAADSFGAVTASVGEAAAATQAFWASIYTLVPAFLVLGAVTVDYFNQFKTMNSWIVTLSGWIDKLVHNSHDLKDNFNHAWAIPMPFLNALHGIGKMIMALMPFILLGAIAIVSIIKRDLIKGITTVAGAIGDMVMGIFNAVKGMIRLGRSAKAYTKTFEGKTRIRQGKNIAANVGEKLGLQKLPGIPIPKLGEQKFQARSPEDKKREKLELMMSKQMMAYRKVAMKREQKMRARIEKDLLMDSLYGNADQKAKAERGNWITEEKKWWGSKPQKVLSAEGKKEALKLYQESSVTSDSSRAFYHRQSKQGKKIVKFGESIGLEKEEVQKRWDEFSNARMEEILKDVNIARQKEINQSLTVDEALAGRQVNLMQELVNVITANTDALKASTYDHQRVETQSFDPSQSVPLKELVVVDKHINTTLFNKYIQRKASGELKANDILTSRRGDNIANVSHQKQARENKLGNNDYVGMDRNYFQLYEPQLDAFNAFFNQGAMGEGADIKSLLLTMDKMTFWLKTMTADGVIKPISESSPGQSQQNIEGASFSKTFFDLIGSDPEELTFQELQTHIDQINAQRTQVGLGINEDLNAFLDLLNKPDTSRQDYASLKADLVTDIMRTQLEALVENLKFIPNEEYKLSQAYINKKTKELQQQARASGTDALLNDIAEERGNAIENIANALMQLPLVNTLNAQIAHKTSIDEVKNRRNKFTKAMLKITGQSSMTDANSTITQAIKEGNLIPGADDDFTALLKEAYAQATNEDRLLGGITREEFEKALMAATGKRSTEGVPGGKTLAPMKELMKKAPAFRRILNFRTDQHAKSKGKTGRNTNASSAFARMANSPTRTGQNTNTRTGGIQQDNRMMAFLSDIYQPNKQGFDTLDEAKQLEVLERANTILLSAGIRVRDTSKDLPGKLIAGFGESLATKFSSRPDNMSIGNTEDKDTFQLNTEHYLDILKALTGKDQKNNAAQVIKSATGSSSSLNNDADSVDFKYARKLIQAQVVKFGNPETGKKLEQLLPEYQEALKVKSTLEGQLSAKNKELDQLNKEGKTSQADNLEGQIAPLKADLDQATQTYDTLNKQYAELTQGYGAQIEQIRMSSVSIDDALNSVINKLSLRVTEPEKFFTEFFDNDEMLGRLIIGKKPKKLLEELKEPNYSEIYEGLQLIAQTKDDATLIGFIDNLGEYYKTKENLFADIVNSGAYGESENGLDIINAGEFDKLKEMLGGNVKDDTIQALAQAGFEDESIQQVIDFLKTGNLGEFSKSVMARTEGDESKKILEAYKATQQLYEQLEEATGIEAIQFARPEITNKDILQIRRNREKKLNKLAKGKGFKSFEQVALQIEGVGMDTLENLYSGKFNRVSDRILGELASKLGKADKDNLTDGLRSLEVLEEMETLPGIISGLANQIFVEPFTNRTKAYNRGIKDYIEKAEKSTKESTQKAIQEAKANYGKVKKDVKTYLTYKGKSEAGFYEQLNQAGLSKEFEHYMVSGGQLEIAANSSDIRNLGAKAGLTTTDETNKMFNEIIGAVGMDSVQGKLLGAYLTTGEHGDAETIAKANQYAQLLEQYKDKGGADAVKRDQTELGIDYADLFAANNKINDSKGAANKAIEALKVKGFDNTPAFFKDIKGTQLGALAASYIENGEFLITTLKKEQIETVKTLLGMETDDQLDDLFNQTFGAFEMNSMRIRSFFLNYREELDRFAAKTRKDIEAIPIIGKPLAKMLAPAYHFVRDKIIEDVTSTRNFIVGQSQSLASNLTKVQDFFKTAPILKQFSIAKEKREKDRSVSLQGLMEDAGIASSEGFIMKLDKALSKKVEDQEARQQIISKILSTKSGKLKESLESIDQDFEGLGIAAREAMQEVLQLTQGGMQALVHNGKFTTEAVKPFSAYLFGALIPMIGDALELAAGASKKVIGSVYTLFSPILAKTLGPIAQSATSMVAKQLGKLKKWFPSEDGIGGFISRTVDAVSDSGVKLNNHFADRTTVLQQKIASIGQFMMSLVANAGAIGDLLRSVSNGIGGAIQSARSKLSSILGAIIGGITSVVDFFTFGLKSFPFGRKKNQEDVETQQVQAAPDRSDRFARMASGGQNTPSISTETEAELSQWQNIQEMAQSQLGEMGKATWTNPSVLSQALEVVKGAMLKSAIPQENNVWTDLASWEGQASIQNKQNEFFLETARAAKPNPLSGYKSQIEREAAKDQLFEMRLPEAYIQAGDRQIPYLDARLIPKEVEEPGTSGYADEWQSYRNYLKEVEPFEQIQETNLRRRIPEYNQEQVERSKNNTFGENFAEFFYGKVSGVKGETQDYKSYQGRIDASRAREIEAQGIPDGTSFRYDDRGETAAVYSTQASAGITGGLQSKIAELIMRSVESALPQDSREFAQQIRQEIKDNQEAVQLRREQLKAQRQALKEQQRLQQEASKEQEKLLAAQLKSRELVDSYLADFQGRQQSSVEGGSRDPFENKMNIIEEQVQLNVFKKMKLEGQPLDEATAGLLAQVENMLLATEGELHEAIASFHSVGIADFIANSFAELKVDSSDDVNNVISQYVDTQKAIESIKSQVGLMGGDETHLDQLNTAIEALNNQAIEKYNESVLNNLSKLDSSVDFENLNLADAIAQYVEQRNTLQEFEQLISSSKPIIETDKVAAITEAQNNKERSFLGGLQSNQEQTNSNLLKTEVIPGQEEEYIKKLKEQVHGINNTLKALTAIGLDEGSLSAIQELKKPLLKRVRGLEQGGQAKAFATDSNSDNERKDQLRQQIATARLPEENTSPQLEGLVATYRESYETFENLVARFGHLINEDLLIELAGIYDDLKNETSSHLQYLRTAQEHLLSEILLANEIINEITKNQNEFSMGQPITSAEQNLLNDEISVFKEIKSEIVNKLIDINTQLIAMRKADDIGGVELAEIERVLWGESLREVNTEIASRENALSQTLPDTPSSQFGKNIEDVRAIKSELIQELDAVNELIKSYQSSLRESLDSVKLEIVNAIANAATRTAEAWQATETSVNQNLENISQKAKEAGDSSGDSMNCGAATRTAEAWQSTETSVIANMNNIRATAIVAGQDTGDALNHNAADRTAAAWERTEDSTVDNIEEIRAAAVEAGEATGDAFENASTQATRELQEVEAESRHMGRGVAHSLNSSSKIATRMATIGTTAFAALTAAHAASSTLVDMGFIDQRTADRMFKFMQFFTLLSALGGVIMPLLEGVGAAFGSIAAAIGAIGPAIAQAGGMMALLTNPITLTIAAIIGIGLALMFVLKRFYNIDVGAYVADKVKGAVSGLFDFLAAGWDWVMSRWGGQLQPLVTSFQFAIDRIKAMYFAFMDSVGTEAIERIAGAWEGFRERFGAILEPIIAFADWVGQGLIGALNCNPTERIPTAWEGAIASITEMLMGLPIIGEWVGSMLSGAFDPMAIFGGFLEKAKEIFAGLSKFGLGGAFGGIQAWLDSLFADKEMNVAATPTMGGSKQGELAQKALNMAKVSGSQSEVAFWENLIASGKAGKLSDSDLQSLTSGQGLDGATIAREVTTTRSAQSQQFQKGIDPARGDALAENMLAPRALDQIASDTFITKASKGAFDSGSQVAAAEALVSTIGSLNDADKQTLGDRIHLLKTLEKYHQSKANFDQFMAGELNLGEFIKAQAKEVANSQLGEQVGEQLNRVKAAATETSLAFGDRMQYLQQTGGAFAGELFEPGMNQMKAGLQTMKGDFTHFAEVAGDALWNLDFEGVGQAFSDLKGNLGSSLGQIISGFNSASLSAIAFGIFSLTSLSPAVLIAGGLALAILAIATNFLGMRTIVFGIAKVFIGLAKIVISLMKAFWDLGKAARTILSGLFNLDIKQIKAGFAQAKATLSKLAGELGEAFKQIFRGVWQIVRGIFEGLAQIVSNPINRIKSGFALLGNAIKTALLKPKQAWDNFINLLDRIRAKVSSVVEAVGDSAVGRAAKAVGLTATKKAPSLQEAQAQVDFDARLQGKNSKLDAIDQVKAKKRGFLGRIFGRKKQANAAALPVASAPEPAALPATDDVQDTEIERLQSMSSVADAASNSLAGLGNVLSFMSPALGGVLFGFSSLFDSFNAIGSSLPVLKGAIISTIPALAAQGATAEATSWIQIWGAVKAAAANLWNAAATTGAAGIMIAAYGAIATAATVAWTAVLAPLMPILLTVGAIIGALGLLWLAFKTNFGGIKDAVFGVWHGIRSFFVTLWNEAKDIMRSLYWEVQKTFGDIWKSFKEIGAVLMIPFKPLLDLFGITGRNSMKMGLIRFLLLPLKLVVEVLKAAVRGVGAIIQAVLFLGKVLAYVIIAPSMAIRAIFTTIFNISQAIGDFIVNVMLMPFRFMRDTLREMAGFLAGIPIIGRVFSSEKGKSEKIQRFAEGGVVTGPGTSIGDKVLAAVSPGEYIVRAKSVAKNIGLLQAINAGFDVLDIPPPPLLALNNEPSVEAKEAGPMPPIVINMNFGDIIVQGADDAKDVARRLAEEAYPQFQRMVRDCLRDLVDKSK